MATESGDMQEVAPEADGEGPLALTRPARTPPQLGGQLHTSVEAASIVMSGRAAAGALLPNPDLFSHGCVRKEALLQLRIKGERSPPTLSWLGWRRSQASLSMTLQGGGPTCRSDRTPHQGSLGMVETASCFGDQGDSNRNFMLEFQ